MLRWANNFEQNDTKTIFEQLLRTVANTHSGGLIYKAALYRTVPKVRPRQARACPSHNIR